MKIFWRLPKQSSLWLVTALLCSCGPGVTEPSAPIKPLPAKNRDAETAPIPESIGLTGVPTDGSTASFVSITISGAALADYRYCFTEGTAACEDSCYSEWRPAEVPLVLPDLGEAGPKKICVMGRNKFQVLQKVATEHRWEQGQNKASIRLELSPAVIEIPVGSILKVAALVTDATGKVLNLSTVASWDISDTAISAIRPLDQSGSELKGLKVGAAKLKVSVNGLSVEAPITVSNAAVESLKLSPATLVLAAGTTLSAKVMGTMSDGRSKDLTEVVTWSTDNAQVAAVSNADKSQGLLLAQNSGEATVWAVLGSKKASASVRVSDAALVSLSIISESQLLVRGSTRQLKVMARFSDRSSQDLTNQVEWSLADSNAAEISNSKTSKGRIKVDKTGLVEVRAALDKVQTSLNIEVVEAKLESIAVRPQDATVPIGNRLALSAFGTYDSGLVADISNDVSWNVANDQVALIRPQDKNLGILTAVGHGLTSVSATLSGIVGATSVEVSPLVLTDLVLTPASLDLIVGQVQALSLSARYNDGSQRDISPQATWRSSDSSIAQISNSGVVTVLASGSATIKAGFGGREATLSLRAQPAVVESIRVSPSATTVLPGGKMQYVAIGTYNNKLTADISNLVTWAAAVPATVSISNSAGSRGLASALATGHTAITAVMDQAVGTAALTVLAAPISITALTLTPDSVIMRAGDIRSFSAVASYSDGSSRDVSAQAAWTMSDEAVARVANTGVVTAQRTGNANVTVSYLSMRASAAISVVVTAPTLASLTITPAQISIPVNESKSLRLRGTYSDGVERDVVDTVSWSSSDTTRASVDSNGLAQSLRPGSATITARVGALTTTAQLTLVSTGSLVTLNLAAAAGSVDAGQTLQIRATGTYSNNVTADLTSEVSWSSANTIVATVSDLSASRGLVTGIESGEVAISASLRGVTGSLTILVMPTPVTLTAVSLNITDTSPKVGESRQLNLTASYSNGSAKDVSAQAVWTTADSRLATVNELGLVTARAEGTTQIRVSFQGKTAVATVRVQANSSGPVALVSVAVSPATNTILVGQGFQYTAVGTYSNGTTKDLTAVAAWTSSNTGQATITKSGGMATAVAVGSSQITAKYLGIISGAATLSVQP